MAGAQALTLAMLAAVGGAAASLPITDAELRDATDVLLEQVAAVRRLPAPRALERRLVTRAEAFAARTEAIAATTGGAELAARARLSRRLGLLPEGADHARLVARTLGAPTASYDPVRRRLSAPDWLPLVDQRAALTHELAHALADQRFGLLPFLKGAQGGDAELARLALIEGDASVTTLEHEDPAGALLSRPELAALSARLRAAPSAPADLPSPWLRAQAVFAHADGLLFVARVRARAPWSAVDALWAQPPASSEQVLHPEKYDARERPVAVAPGTPPALGAGWREAAADVLGELGVRTWLEVAVSPARAARAAAGWGGDRAVLFEPLAAGGADAGPPPAPFVAWSTVWDDVTDAEDFARTAAAVLAARAGSAAQGPDDPHRVVARGAAGVFALVWRDKAVCLLLGAPEVALPALDQLLQLLPAPAPAKLRPSPRPSPADGRGRIKR